MHPAAQLGQWPRRPMFVRRTKTFSSPSGPGYTLRLCQSVRSRSRARQVTLLSLGVRFDILQRQWREFASLVEAFDQGQQPLAISDSGLIEAARNAADRLRMVAQSQVAARAASHAGNRPSLRPHVSWDKTDKATNLGP